MVEAKKSRPVSPSFAALPEGIITPARIARFWSHVERGEGERCWLWTGERREARRDRPRGGGYGVYVIDAQGVWVRFKAHRFAFESTYGPIPDGLLCLHKCDVRLCVRPDHLFLGTHRNNAHDMMRKGRGWGRNPPKLTPEQVRHARRRLANGEGPTEVGALYGLKRDRVRDIQAGKAYVWVPPN